MNPIKLYNLTPRTAYKLKTKQMNKNAIWEAVKEPLRLLVLSIIPLILVYFQTINAQWAALIVVALRFVDKYLHELGKENENENLKKGIVRF